MNCLVTYQRTNQPGSLGASLARQRAEIDAWCERTGRQSPSAVYVDVASGMAVDTAPGWLQLLEDVAAGKIDTVVLADLSRLGRDTGAIGRLRALQAAGIEVIVL